MAWEGVVGGILGGAAGFAIGGPMGAAAGASAGAALGGGMSSAKAAEKAAKSEADLASQNVFSAMPTAQELEQQSIMLANQQQQINFSKQQIDSLGDLLSQISPMLAEGFNQQLASMRGQNVGPISRQIEIERQQNLNRQIASMGSGASGSSAGMMADALFGQQAGMARLQEQQAMSQMNAQNAQVATALMGQGAQFGQYNQNISNSILGNMNQLKQREMQARFGQVGTAGAGQVGNIMMGQQLQSMGSTVLGATAGGYAQGLGQAKGFQNMMGTS